MQDTLQGVDGMRMEHIWLVVAAECISVLRKTISSDEYIVEHVGQLLQDRLHDLCQFYDEKLLCKKKGHKTESGSIVTAEQLALELWNTDVIAGEVRHGVSWYT